jgi:predicted RNA-binding protein
MLYRFRSGLCVVVLGVIEAEFHAERALVIDEPADTDVVLRPEQIAVENCRPRERVVALDIVNEEVVADGRLRNMDVRRRPVFLVVSPGKIPFTVAEKPDGGGWNRPGGGSCPTASTADCKSGADWAYAVAPAASTASALSSIDQRHRRIKFPQRHRAAMPRINRSPTTM